MLIPRIFVNATPLNQIDFHNIFIKIDVHTYAHTHFIPILQLQVFPVSSYVLKINYGVKYKPLTELYIKSKSFRIRLINFTVLCISCLNAVVKALSKSSFSFRLFDVIRSWISAGKIFKTASIIGKYLSAS